MSRDLSQVSRGADFRPRDQPVQQLQAGVCLPGGETSQVASVARGDRGESGRK